MEAALAHRDVETTQQPGLPELEAQAPGLLDVVPSVAPTRILHLEHLPRHGRLRYARAPDTKLTPINGGFRGG